jgi:PKD repeat protein
MSKLYSTIFILTVCILLSTPLYAQTTPCDSLANFTWSAQCNSVQFTPTFPEPGATYSWDFGDGGSSTEVNPSHVYFAAPPASYTVKLTVIDDDDCPLVSKSFVVNTTIAAGGLPVASMQSLGVGITLKDDFLNCNASKVTPTSDDFNLNVQNTSQGVVPATTYEIIWGDNSPVMMLSSFSITNHLYMQMGLYDIVLIATNPNGCADTAHYEFFNGREPAAGIGVSPSANLCCPPATIVFENTPSVISANPPGTDYIYTVETGCEPLFADTIPHTDPFTPFEYTFNRGSCEPDCILPNFPGQFNVTMTAVNKCGSQESSGLLRLCSNIVADMEMPSHAIAGEPVCVVNRSEGYYWNDFTQSCASKLNLTWRVLAPGGYTLVSGALGDIFTPGTETICILFDTAGEYMIELIGKYPLLSFACAGAPCCNDTIRQSLVVCDPLANFTWSAQCNSVQFTTTFPEPGATYSWDFGDGGSSTEVNPSHVYFTQVDTQYTVRLTVVSGNCIDTFNTMVPIAIAAGGLPVAGMISLGIGLVLQAPFLHCLASVSNPDLVLSVENMSSNVSPNSMYSINWGDGTPATMPSAFGTTSHGYNAMGLFPIILQVKNANGCVDTAQYEFFNGREPGVGIGIPASADLCAPATIDFITPPGLEINPPGTAYIFQVETGCEPIFTDTIPHTSPLTPFIYTFNSSSCDPDCLLPDAPGAFRVSITAVNPCGASSGGIFPRIAAGINASFDAPDFAVAGDTVCLVSTAVGNIWNPFSQSCAGGLNIWWDVMPVTGFTIASGNAGSPSSEGSDSLCLQFSQSGTYSVTLHAARAASGCPPDSATFTKTISVTAVSTDDPSLEQQIRIMPNPAGGRCILEVPPALEVQSCVVYNLLGMRLFEQNFDQPPYSLDLSDRASGAYLIHIMLKNGRSIVKKLIN